MGHASIRIGTSGWHYKHWMNDFYPAGLPSAKMLSWYANHFDTVELNNTFYRLPTEEALLNWKKTAPKDFLFSVKASRFITHMKRLIDPETTVENFFVRANLLGRKIGPVLFQFPQQWSLNQIRLGDFLKTLPRNRRYVFEFRHVSWFAPPVYDLLRQHNAALCLHDWQGIPWPEVLTADFTYLRFHGPTGSYGGSYSLPVLKNCADRIRRWQDSLKRIFVYFNNDIGGHAISNALTLKNLLNP